MGLPLEELQERMTSAEYALHLADFRRNPWGPARQEFDTALLCVAVRTALGDECSTTDFMPYRKRRAAHDPETLLRELMRRP
jgi:hypothetical protein